MPKRQGNNPKRRIVPAGALSPAVLARIEEKARYCGNAHHKRKPADYGFHPPVNPRPHKSLCDGGRSVKLGEAKALFREGVRRGMVSAVPEDGLPKHVWAVDREGRAYEAKLGRSSRYHGCELGGDDEAMRRWVIEQWRARCPAR